MLRVGELAVPRQLVGLLPVLPTTLAVALSGDGAVAGVRSADQPEGQGEVDVGLGGLGAVAVLLRPPGGEDHRGLRLGQGVNGLPQRSDTDAGDPLHPVRPVGAHPGAHAGEPAGPLAYVVLVDQTVPDGQVQQPVGQGEVGSGRWGQVDRGAVGRRRPPRVDDDVGGPLLPARVEPLHRRRHGGRRVGPDEEDRLGLGDVGQRERQPPVDTEGPVGRGRGRRHAEPAVVVDHRRPQRYPSELAEGVRLLVRQPAAAEAADRVPPVRLLGLSDAGHDRGERLVPGRRTERAGPFPRDGAQQWGEQALRMVQQGGGGPALRAEATAVGRKVRLRLQHGRAPSSKGGRPPLHPPTRSA